jgi:hypothetical protein
MLTASAGVDEAWCHDQPRLCLMIHAGAADAVKVLWAHVVIGEADAHVVGGTDLLAGQVLGELSLDALDEVRTGQQFETCFSMALSIAMEQACQMPRGRYSRRKLPDVYRSAMWSRTAFGCGPPRRPSSRSPGRRSAPSVVPAHQVRVDSLRPGR